MTKTTCDPLTESVIQKHIDAFEHYNQWEESTVNETPLKLLC